MRDLLRPRKILLAMTGSIACFKGCALLSKLVQSGYDLEVIATAGALEFVGRASLEGLIGKTIHTDTFEPGRYMAHIHLAKWADLTLIYPASANALNKFAAGIGDDLLSTTLLAHDFQRPAQSLWLAPAMNTKMYQHPATVASRARLRVWGVRLLEPDSGSLACGDVGEGRLIEPDEMVKAIDSHFVRAAAADQAWINTVAASSPRASGSLKILVTSGGSREPIDGVRAICNTSTGQTGATIAEHLARRGHRVTLLRAEGAIPARLADREHFVEPEGERFIKQITYTDFASLEKKLESLLVAPTAAERFGAVIHLAAVADYSVESIVVSDANCEQEMQPSSSLKINSDHDLQLRLKRNPKLVDRLRKWSGNPQLLLAAFKLTNTESHEARFAAVQKLSSHAQADWIIHNDRHEINDRHHRFSVYDGKQGANQVSPLAQLDQVSELAEWLSDALARTHAAAMARITAARDLTMRPARS